MAGDTVGSAPCPAGHLGSVLVAIPAEEENSNGSTSEFQASTGIMLADLSLANTSHMVKARPQGGGQPTVTWPRVWILGRRDLGPSMRSAIKGRRRRREGELPFLPQTRSHHRILSCDFPTSQHMRQSPNSFSRLASLFQPLPGNFRLHGQLLGHVHMPMPRLREAQ